MLLQLYGSSHSYMQELASAVATEKKIAAEALARYEASIPAYLKEWCTYNGSIDAFRLCG